MLYVCVCRLEGLIIFKNIKRFKKLNFKICLMNLLCFAFSIYKNINLLIIFIFKKWKLNCKFVFIFVYLYKLWFVYIYIYMNK